MRPAAAPLVGARRLHVALDYMSHFPGYTHMTPFTAARVSLEPASTRF
jgi:hypothetical protein